MASSEIEVVSSSSSVSKSNDQPVILDVFTASAHGDFNKLRTFVEQYGASVSVPDISGYYALQWASLNNFHDIAHYLIQVPFDVIPLILFECKIWAFLFYFFNLSWSRLPMLQVSSSLGGYVSVKRLIVFMTLGEVSL